MKTNFRYSLKRLIAYFLAVVLMVLAQPFFATPAAATPEASAAQQTGKRVRLGYYAEPGMMNGAAEGVMKSGYCYEYMQEIAGNAGWKYEYVYGSFSELYQKLLTGEIDMLPYITISEERKKIMLFPDKQCGDEQFYLASLKPDRLSTALSELVGKKIATTKDAFQNIPFNELIRQKGIKCELVELTNPEARWIALTKGDVDYSIETSTAIQSVEMHAVCEFGERYPYYTVVTSGRRDLLEEMNAARRQLDEVQPTFMENLRQRYFRGIPLFKGIPIGSRVWLREHGSIRVGAYDSDAPYIYKDEQGNFRGVAPDYLKLMLNALNVTTPVEWKLYRGREEAIKALNAGEIDAINPYYHSYSDAEHDGVIISDGVHRSKFSVLYLGEYTENTMKLIATPETRLGASYVRDYYPEARIVSCQNGYDCIDKLLEGKANSVVVHTDALVEIAASYKKDFKFKALNADCPVCFAALPKDAPLIAIFNKARPFVTDVEMNIIQDRYNSEDHSQASLLNVLKSHPEIIAIGIAGFLALALLFLVTKRRADKEHSAKLEDALAETQAANEKIREQSIFTGQLLQVFESAYYINLDDLSFQVYKRSPELEQKYPIVPNYVESLGKYISDEVHPADRERMAILLNAPRLKEVIAEQPELDLTFRVISGAEERTLRCQVLRSAEAGYVAMCFRDVTEEIRLQQNRQKMEELTAAYSREYEAAYVCNLADATFRFLTRKESVARQIEGLSSFGEAARLFAENSVHPDDVEKFSEDLYSIEKLEDKLAVGEQYGFEYRSRAADGEYTWHRAVINRISDDQVLIGFKDCDREIRDRLVTEKLMGEYDAIYVVDLDKNEVTTARASSISDVGAFEAKNVYSEKAQQFAEVVAPAYREEWLKFSNPEYMRNYMAEEDHREYVFELPTEKNSMRRFSADVLERVDGKANIVLFSFMGIDDTRAQAIRLNREMAAQKEQLQKNFDIIEILASEYTSVYYINLATDGLTPYTMNESTESAFGKIFRSGITYSEAYGMYVNQQVLAEDKEMMLEAGSVRNIMKELQAKKTFLTTYRDAKGHYSEMKFVKVGAETGKPLAVALGFADKDEELRAKQEAETERQRNIDIIEILASEYSSVYYIDLTTDELDPYTMNEETESEFGNIFRSGINYSDAFRLYVDSLVYDEDKAMMLGAGSVYNILKELADKKTFTTTYRSDNNGDPHYCEMKFVKVGDEENPQAVALGFADKDEQIRAELARQEQLRNALAVAENASRSKTDFLFNMSHDIRTPMNAIIGFTELAKRHLDDKEKVADSLDKIETSGNHLLDLINEVLDMSRVEAGKLKSELKVVSVSKAAQKLIDICQETAVQRNIKLNVDCSNIQDDTVLADELHVNQIIMNILGNSLKYTMPGGSIDYTVEQIVSERPGYGRYRCTVRDTGIGMSKEFLAKVFESFSREETSTISGIQGTGLGMSIVKRLVDYMDGTVDIQSEQGVGTTVTVCLYMKLADAAVEESKENVVHDTDLRGRKVLLAEDNELNREIATEILRENGMTVDEAVNGREAVECIREKGSDYYDFVLMDIQMPLMDGYTATQEIRKLEGAERLPIIALSANAFEEDRKKSLEAGMNDHVAKPIVLAELLSVLAKFAQ